MAKEIQLHAANFKAIGAFVIGVRRWCGGGIAIHSSARVCIQNAVVTAT